MFKVIMQEIQGIHELTVEPDSGRPGGVLVLKGPNGSGKSRGIAIIRALLTGSGRFAPSDGEKRGTAEGFGRTLTATPAQTRFSKDDLDCNSLEGKLDFSDLVHPLKKTPETRDADRMIALVALGGVTADISRFYSLTKTREEFDATVAADVRSLDDPVLMGKKIGRAFHDRKKKAADAAESARANLAACQAACEGIDFKSPPDLPALHKASQEAAADHQALIDAQEDGEQAAARSVQAEKELQALKDNYFGKPVAESAKIVEDAKKDVADRETFLAGARKVVQDAEAALLAEQNALKAAEKALESATQHENAVASFIRLIDTAKVVQTPAPERIEAAAKAKSDAIVAIERAAVVQEAFKKKAEADKHRADAQRLEREAQAALDAANGVDEVVSSFLPAGPLQWKGERMVLKTERGPYTPFDELSNGEKWSVALPYGIRSVGAGGVLAVIQDAWQDLDRDHQLRIARECEAAGVWLVTGAVAEGELRAEVFEATGA